MNGCLTFPTYSYKNNLTKVFQPAISSTPSGAEIYLNGKFVGMTPIDKPRIKVRYGLVSWGGGPWSLNEADINGKYSSFKYYIIVKKEGYRTLAARLEFERLGEKDFALKKNSYLFKLQEKQNSKSQTTNGSVFSEDKNLPNFIDIIFKKDDYIVPETNEVRGYPNIADKAIGKTAVVTLEKGFSHFKILSRIFFVNESDVMNGDTAYQEVEDFNPQVSLVYLKIQCFKEKPKDVSGIIYDAYQTATNLIGFAIIDQRFKKEN